jgi:hypothetical protein
MHLLLARPGAIATKLTGLHIDKTNIFALHEALAAKRRRAKNEIFADTNGKIASITIGISLAVNSLTHLADGILDAIDRGRIEEFIELATSLGLRPLAPIVDAIHKRRRYV